MPLLRDGKGLESAPRRNLDEVEQEVQAIETGKGVTPYRIVWGRKERPAGRRAVASSDIGDFAPK